jgi:riboflavin kinase/FMN adenylyltransferase
LKKCRELAAAQGATPGVVTFENHPDALVLGETPKLLNTPGEKALLFAHYGITRVVSLPFDRALMAQPWEDFLRLLVEKYDAAGFVCGADFRFGAKGLGDSEKLTAFCREQGLACAVVPEQEKEGIRISSTYIRALLRQGEMEKAVAFLGHPHILQGTVVKGNQLGRTIGIPTANILPAPGVEVPRNGVYACKVYAEGKAYLAVTNVGSRPTVDGEGLTIEPWLMDFAGDLYGKEITLCFYQFLRPEKKFPSLEELQAEILKNAHRTREILGKS